MAYINSPGKQMTMPDKSDTNYRKPSWLQKNVKIIYITALLVFLPSWLWISWITLDERAHRELYREVFDDLSLFADSLNSELEKYRFIPKVLMLDASLLAQANNPDLASAIDQSNQRLQHIRLTTNADEVFIMDPKGTTIASTKLDNIGDRYQNSPFFSCRQGGRVRWVFHFGFTRRHKRLLF